METGPAHNELHLNIYTLILMLIENAASSSRSPPSPTDGIALTAIGPVRKYENNTKITTRNACLKILYKLETLLMSQSHAGNLLMLDLEALS